MSLQTRLLERKIGQHIEEGIESLVPQLNIDQQSYPVQIGRTPRSMLTFEHTKVVAEGILEHLGGLGVDASLEYDEYRTRTASTFTRPGSYFGAPLGIEVVTRREPVVVLKNLDFKPEPIQIPPQRHIPYCPPGGILGVDYSRHLWLFSSNPYEWFR